MSSGVTATTRRSGVVSAPINVCPADAPTSPRTTTATNDACRRDRRTSTNEQKPHVNPRKRACCRSGQCSQCSRSVGEQQLVADGENNQQRGELRVQLKRKRSRRQREHRCGRPNPGEDVRSECMAKQPEQD